MVGRGGTKEEIMKAKATRRLIAAVGLSALAAVVASSAQARIPEGNGTRPPAKAVVVEQQVAPGDGTFFVDPEIYTALTSLTVSSEQQTATVLEPRLARHRTRTSSYEQQAATVLEPRLARHRAGTSSIDAETCAALDPAIRAAIQGCARAVPLAAQQLGTGRAQQQLESFPAGYRGLP
jgi:hypothetical protein